jgi:hypothetical protein
MPSFTSDGPDIQARSCDPVAIASRPLPQGQEAEPRRGRAAERPSPSLVLTHGVAAAGASGVVGGRTPKAPLGAGHPRRSGERAPRMGPRRGAPVPAAPLPPPPHPHRHLPMRRTPCGGHASRDAAARVQDPPLPAEQVGAAAAGRLHLAAQEVSPGARRRRLAAGPPGSGDPVPRILGRLISRPIQFTLGLRLLGFLCGCSRVERRRGLASWQWHARRRRRRRCGSPSPPSRWSWCSASRYATSCTPVSCCV